MSTFKLSKDPVFKLSFFVFCSLCKSQLLPPLCRTYCTQLKENKHTGETQTYADAVSTDISRAPRELEDILLSGSETHPLPLELERSHNLLSRGTGCYKKIFLWNRLPDQVVASISPIFTVQRLTRCVKCKSKRMQLFSNFINGHFIFNGIYKTYQIFKLRHLNLMAAMQLKKSCDTGSKRLGK